VDQHVRDISQTSGVAQQGLPQPRAVGEVARADADKRAGSARRGAGSCVVCRCAQSTGAQVLNVTHVAKVVGLHAGCISPGSSALLVAASRSRPYRVAYRPDAIVVGGSTRWCPPRAPGRRRLSPHGQHRATIQSSRHRLAQISTANAARYTRSTERTRDQLGRAGHRLERRHLVKHPLLQRHRPATTQARSPGARRDAARLSSLGHDHLNELGRLQFPVLDPDAGSRPCRRHDPHTDAEEAWD
jgi:hypothetical protein